MIGDLLSSYRIPGDGLVKFGTSGHRGSSILGTFNENHILAICQAICDLRQVDGPLMIGRDTHALSEPALLTALEVFAGNGVEVIAEEGFSPTPVMSHAVLSYNSGRTSGLADAVILTPSHNPPTDGGLKYNPSHGGPAGSDVTTAIEFRANELIQNGLSGVRRRSNPCLPEKGNWMESYIEDLENTLDMDAISKSGIKLGVDPMGGAAVHAWEPIANRYRLDLEVVNHEVDPSFGFMPPDHDGKIRMDCSSPDAMANLVHLRDRFDVAFGNDPDVDRHGIVTRSGGLMNPNHYLSVVAEYLFDYRPEWSTAVSVAKTVVTSGMVNRVAKHKGRSVFETPVGFKWFVDGLMEGKCGCAMEESAGASLLKRDGIVWTTDKDGIIMALLAAEIMAVTERDIDDIYYSLEKLHGRAYYKRVDAPASENERSVLGRLSPDMVQADTLAGEQIIQKLTKASGNNAPIGGLKVETSGGWFAARPSGTEPIYKIYAESFKSAEHLEAILHEARAVVSSALEEGGN